MTTRITVTFNGGEALLQQNAQQQAANRQGFLVKANANEAALEGRSQREAELTSKGLNPSTGRPLGRSGSRLTRTDQKPAAYRDGGKFYVGVAWLEIIEDTEAGTGTIRIGSGDASQWAETSMVPYVQYDDVATFLSESEYEAYLGAVPKPPIDNFNTGAAIARTPIPVVHWYKQIESPTVGGDIIGLSLDWFASAKRVDLGSGSQSILEIDVLPAGKDAAYVICSDERVQSFAWCNGLYYGYHYFDYAADTNLFADGFYPIEQDTYNYRARKVTVFYVTRTSVVRVQTPIWADETYSLRKHGTYAASTVSDTFTGFRNPADFFYATFGPLGTYPMPLNGPAQISYPPIGQWINDPPGWEYTVDAFYTLTNPLPYNQAFPSFPETDTDSFPTGGDLFYLRPYRGVWTPLEFYKGANDFINDASTPELKTAYGMVPYLYQADTTNYSPTPTTSVLNGFAQNQEVSRTAQEVFDGAIAAQFLGFKSSTGNRYSRSAFASVGTATINGAYASPIYFSDWERPDFCATRLQSLGFAQNPIA